MDNNTQQIHKQDVNIGAKFMWRSATIFNKTSHSNRYNACFVEIDNVGEMEPVVNESDKTQNSKYLVK